MVRSYIGVCLWEIDKRRYRLMIVVTDRAAEELRNTLVAVEPEAEQILRLVYTPDSGFALTLDVEREGDQVVESEGQKVLAISSEISNAVTGATIDVRDTTSGPRLVISREGEEE